MVLVGCRIRGRLWYSPRSLSSCSWPGAGHLFCRRDIVRRDIRGRYFHAVLRCEFGVHLGSGGDSGGRFVHQELATQAGDLEDRAVYGFYRGDLQCVTFLRVGQCIQGLPAATEY